MEISEYLTRINLKGADNTLFKREEREVKLVKDGKESLTKILGINSYTFFENGSGAVLGFIRYEKEFPEQVFALDPEVLQKVMEISDSITIEDTFLVGKTKYGDVKRDLKFMKWRRASGKYENDPLTLKHELIQGILDRNSVIDSSYVTIVGDGTNLGLTLFPKIGQGTAQINIPSEINTDCRFESTMFMEILKLTGSSDARLYLDIPNPEDRKTSPMRLDVTDKNAQITYYLTQAAVEMSQVASESEPKKKSKKEKKEAEKEPEKEPEVDEKESEEESIESMEL